MISTPRRLLLTLAAGALLLAPLVAVQLATGAGRAHACSCVEPAPPLEALEGVAAVFSGTVRSFDTHRFEVDFGSDRSESYWSVEIEVDTVWKGSVTATTYVYIWHGAACGFDWFVEGENFIVYAFQRDFRGVDADTLFVSLCSRSAPIERAAEDLHALGEGHVPEDGVTGADPASSAEEEGTPAPTPTSQDPPRSPAPPATGSGPALDDGERIAGPGASDAATTREASAGPPAWAIPLLGGFVAASVLVRLAVRPRLRA
ncbi:MAG: hypothetical protein F4Z25_10870 [Chloroflexi bacterium]|nr:hypothetical protein [Chloroflexota bacterium]